MSGARAVIFDLDGCLVDSEPLALEAIAAEMRELGIGDASSEEIGERFLGVSISVIRDHVAMRSGLPCPEDFVDRVEERLFEAYRLHLKRIEGVAGLLDRLDQAGIATALATGGSIRRMRRTLRFAGLADRFKGRAFSADEVARGKPAPDLVLHAAQQIGMAPENCVVVEDSPHGVTGAVTAGMRAVGFVGGSHLAGIRDKHAALLRKTGASHVVWRLEEAFDAIFAPTEPVGRRENGRNQPGTA